MNGKIHIAIVYNDLALLTETAQKSCLKSRLGERLIPQSVITNPELDRSLSCVEEEIGAIETALLSSGYKVSVITVDGDIVNLINQLKSKKPDLIFNLCESIDGKPFQEVNVTGIYELLRIPFTGAPSLTLGWAANKIRAKEILGYHNIPTPRYRVYQTAYRINWDENLTPPLIVKPPYEDASNGIDNSSVVWNINELKKRARYIAEKFGQPVLVEEYIDGRELHVAIIGNAKPTVFPITEIDFSEMPEYLHNIMSYDAKWISGSEAFSKTKSICPARLSKALEAKVKDIALKAYHIMGCRDYARIDVRLSKENTPYVLEVNPNPDLSRNTEFVQSVTASGLSFEGMIERIAALGLERRI